MASSGSVFSETLQSITTTKLQELSKKQTNFDQQYSNLRAALQQEESPLQRLFVLAEGTKVCFGAKTQSPKVKDLKGEERLGKIVGYTADSRRPELDLKNIDRFLEQARFDPSVSADLLAEWEQTLLRYLDVQSLKYNYATLYGRVVTEWLSSQRLAGAFGDEVEKTDAYEDIPGPKRLESRAEFERSVFEPYDTDQSALMNYLDELFGRRDTDKEGGIFKAFQRHKKSVSNFENKIDDPYQFERDTVERTIKGLLASDLLTDEKRAVLNDFLGNQAVLGEITDVLNMRMEALDDWSWGEHVLVEQNRRVNGTYWVRQHEDLLQAMLLQHIGVSWAVFFKGALKELFQNTVASEDTTTISGPEKKRREYYLGPIPTGRSVQTLRRNLYLRNYCLFQLLDSEEQHIEMGDGEEEVEYSHLMGPESHKKKSPQKDKVGQTAARHRRIPPEATKPKKPIEAKHTLLHLLATEITVNTRIHGEITSVHSKFNDWHSSLPHSTILAVLEYFGVSTKWLSFFRKFLEAPLKFMDEESVGPRTRRRGTPGSHVLSDVFGEVVLFCLDFSVARIGDNTFLHRVQDSFWFWSPDHAKCVQAWKEVGAFCDAMGVSLSNSARGAVRISRDPSVRLEMDPILPRGPIRWGFLYLDPASGLFEIDQSLIDTHIEDLHRQLRDKRTSVFNWIQAWNAYATTFFTTNFGKPANCFGRRHVDQMLSTYERIYRALFPSDSGNVVNHVKEMLKERFRVVNVPNGFLFFPIELGGLELKNPFIGPLQMREAIQKEPSEHWADFEKAEKEHFRESKRKFERGETRANRHELNDPEWVPEKDKDAFMTFEEYAHYREDLDYGYSKQLLDVFERLMQRPTASQLEGNAKVKDGISVLDNDEDSKGIFSPWSRMEPYWKFVAQLYGPELMNRFDGLSIVDPELLPIGMVSLFRDKRADWSG